MRKERIDYTIRISAQECAAVYVLSTMKKSRSAKLTLHALVIVALSIESTMLSAASPFFDLETSLLYHTNVGFADQHRDRRDDFILSGRGTAGVNVLINEWSGLSLKSDVEVNRFAQLDDLNSVVLTASARYKLQPTQGFTAPWYSFEVAASFLGHEDSDIRDGTVLAFTAVAGKRFSDRIEARAGYGYEDRDAHQGRVFETNTHSVFAGLDYNLTDRAVLFGTYTLSRGDVVSTAPFSTQIFLGADAIALDPALGAGQIAWRLDATTHHVETGASFTLNRHNFLQLAGEYFEANGNLDNDYDGLIVRLSYFHQF